MALQFFEVERGVTVSNSTGSNFQIIPVNQDPNLESSSADASIVPAGSFAVNTADGTWWRKVSNGTGLGTWYQLVDASMIASLNSNNTWRYPNADAFDAATITYSAAVASINNTNTVDGYTVVPGSRILYSVVGDNDAKNIFNVEPPTASLTFGTTGVDTISLAAKQKGVFGNSISVAYTTNSFDNNPVTRAALTTVVATASHATIGSGPDSITYTAVTEGTAGNSIQVLYTNAADNRADTVATVSGTVITVHLKNNGTNITATANDVVAAINDAGGKASVLVTSVLAVGAIGSTVISNTFTGTLSTGVDDDNQIVVSLANTWVALTSTGTITATSADVVTAIKDCAANALVIVNVVVAGTVAGAHAKTYLTGGTNGAATLSSARIGTAAVDMVNLLSKDVVNTRTVAFSTNNFNAQTSTTVTAVGNAYTVNLKNNRVCATLLAGTPSSNEIKYTASTCGALGNSITVTLTVNGWNNAPASTISVSGNNITVNLANSGGNTITTTVQQVINLINNTVASNVLVSAAIGVGSTGTNPVSVLAQTSLAGGQSNILATVQDVIDAINNSVLSSVNMTASVGAYVSGSTVIGAEYAAVGLTGGVVGSWVLIGDSTFINAPVVEGDQVYINSGNMFGGRLYSFRVINGVGNWVWIGELQANELGYISAYIGKSGSGSQLPQYTSTNFITVGDSLTTAISKLDQEIGPNVVTANFVKNTNSVNQNIAALNAGLASVKYTNKVKNIPASTPTILDSIPTNSFSAMKFYVSVRDKAGVASHAYIGTQNVDKTLITASQVGTDGNTLRVLTTTNNFNGASSTTVAVAGTLDGVNPVVITVNLKNDGASLITATASEVLTAINTDPVSSQLVVASLVAGTVGSNVVPSTTSVQSLIDGADSSARVNSSEIYAASDWKNSSPSGVATNIDWSQYSKLSSNNLKIPGLAFSFTLTGTGASQVANLLVTANDPIDVVISRSIVDSI